MAKVAVLGAGVMGSALAFPLADNGHDVAIVGTAYDAAIIDSLQSTRIHPGLGVTMPHGVSAYHLEHIDEAFEDATVVIVGVASVGIAWAGEVLARLLRPGTMVVTVTKGMTADDDGTLRSLPEAMAACLPGELASQVEWSAACGPSIAREVALRVATTVVFAGDDEQSLDSLASLFRTAYYHVWTTTDMLGAEICAAVKNVYAFAVGVGQGIGSIQMASAEIREMASAAGEIDGGWTDAAVGVHVSEEEAAGRASAVSAVAESFTMLAVTSAHILAVNPGASMFAQGCREMRQFVTLAGGDPATADGIAGIGDFFVTCTGGRNVQAGRFIGAGASFDEVQASLMRGVTIEGVSAMRTLGPALTTMTKRGVIGEKDFPLFRYLYAVVVEGERLPVPWDDFYGGGH